jgi:hypothetical protein
MGEMAYMRMPMPNNTISMAPVPLSYGTGTMGGMFTVFKVRDNLTSYADPGWYRHPSGTRAEVASAAELRRDGIKLA